MALIHNDMPLRAAVGSLTLSSRASSPYRGPAPHIPNMLHIPYPTGSPRRAPPSSVDGVAPPQNVSASSKTGPCRQGTGAPGERPRRGSWGGLPRDCGGTQALQPDAPEQGAHAGLTEAVPALRLLGAAEHQAALLALVLVLHGLDEALLVATLLGDQHGRPGSTLRVQLQRGVGRQGAGRVQLLTGLHPRRRGSIRAGTWGGAPRGLPASSTQAPAWDLLLRCADHIIKALQFKMQMLLCVISPSADRTVLTGGSCHPATTSLGRAAWPPSRAGPAASDPP